MSLPTITLEEHFLSQSLGAQQPNGGLKSLYAHFDADVTSCLEDLSSNGRRLREMDTGHVSLQVISHSPGASSSDPSLCRATNDELAAAIAQRPERLAGFACLPMGHPEDAAKELERCVKDLRFVGALVDNHTRGGDYYDDDRFWVVFDTAQKLDVPLYIHPTFPTEEMSCLLYKGNYGKQAESILGAAAFGWHADCGLHLLRLFAAGVFDKYPSLKIILGHMGELLPFQLERSDKMSKRFGGEAGRKSLLEVWNTNVWVTTSGMFSTNPMACMLRNTKIERIMYSVDWPFARNELGWEFLQDLKQSGLLKEGELEKIAYKNAEELLQIRIGDKLR